MAGMTVDEAGRLGGHTTRERYGTEFYRRIGKVGGQRTAELYRDLLKERGRKGGRPKRPALDEYMREQGR
jgi:general stress protein YciG